MPLGAVRTAIVLTACTCVLGAATQAGHAAPAAAPALQDRNCTVTGDKVASPVRVLLGDTVQVRLTLKAECPPAVLHPADVVLAVDQSVSMAQDGKLTAAKAAARSFVADSDLTLHRVAVVSFAASATTRIGLSQDRAAIEAAIDGIGIAPSTNIADAIDASAQILRDTGRPDAKRAIILISDGSPNQPTPDPRTASIRSANFAKLEGAVIFAIGLGSDADASLLQALASGPEYYYFAPGPDDLQAIYEAIAVVIAGSAVTDVSLVDDLASQVSLLAGSIVPSAAVTGRQLTWTAPGLSSVGLTWTYQITADRAGTYPTNDRAVATYTNADGVRGEFTFPRPEITVVDPNAARPCTDPSGWSVLVHAFPDSAGGLSSGSQGCNNRFDSADWFAGTHPGLPTLEFELTDGTGTRVLYRGSGVRGPGRVDQRLLIRACEPPPYRLRLVTSDLNGYELCTNSPAERVIPASRYRLHPFRSLEMRFGFADS